MPTWTGPVNAFRTALGAAALSGATEQGDRLSTYILKLYVSGASHRAQTALANLSAICERELRGQYKLEVIDVLTEPDRAERDKVLATPTLIKELPPPLRRVIGDLSDRDKVLVGLEVRERDPEKEIPASSPETSL